MKEQKKVKNRLKQNKGITLIALVITVVVLLILAGVSINAITGIESAIEKAKEARTANENANELDSIKLAIVEAVTHGNDGLVAANDLKTALEGLVTDTSVITGSAPWTVTGAKTGIQYKIYANGSVEVLSGVTYTETAVDTIVITSSALNLKTSGTTTGTITVAGRGALGSDVALQTADIAKIEYTSNNTSYATVEKQADGSAIVTAKSTVTGSQSTTISVKYDKNGNGTYEDDETVGSVAVNVTEASVWGIPELQTYYGNDVTYTSYNNTTDWQLFYRNETHTYLIKKELGSNVSPVQGSYTKASFDDDVPTNMAKRLNPKLASEKASLFTADTLNNNMKALAYKCDTTVWSGYTSENTTANAANTNTYAVIAPSIELLVASFNADTTDINKTSTLTTPITGTYGYVNSWGSTGILPSGYNNGIYNKGGSTYWWIASPRSHDKNSGLSVDGYDSLVGNHSINNTFAARPLVCIPNSSFDVTTIAGYSN